MLPVNSEKFKVPSGTFLWTVGRRRVNGFAAGTTAVTKLVWKSYLPTLLLPNWSSWQSYLPTLL